MSTTSPRVRVRTALVWCGTTGALATSLRLAYDAVHSGPTPVDFAGALVVACTVAAATAAAWLWLLASSLAVEVIRTGTVQIAGGGRVRRALVTACGLAILAAPATAHAATTANSAVTTERGAGGGQGDHDGRRAHPLDGLPLPERAEGGPAGLRGGTSTAHKPLARQVPGIRDAVRVRPGDSLWAIAADRLGPAATTADVAAYWPEIYAANRSTVGADPDVILPDQQLDLPTQEGLR